MLDQIQINQGRDILQRIQAKVGLTHCNQTLNRTEKDFWRMLWVNKIYRTQFGGRYFLTLRNQDLEATLRWLEVYPSVKAKADFFHSDEGRNSSSEEQSLGASYSNTLELLNYAVCCMFYETVVSRSGLPKDRHLSQVILDSFDENPVKDLDKWVLKVQPYNHADRPASEIWIYTFQFGCYDEVRILSDMPC